MDGQGLTYPFCRRVLSVGGGAPKGRAVLLREALGAKVYLGGSAGVLRWGGGGGGCGAGVRPGGGGGGGPPPPRKLRLRWERSHHHQEQ